MTSPVLLQVDPLEQSLALADASAARLAAVEEAGVAAVTRVHSEALAGWTASASGSSDGSGAEGSAVLTAAVLASLVAALRSTVLAAEAEGRVFVSQQAELLGAVPSNPENASIAGPVQQAVVDALRAQVSLGSGSVLSKRDAEERARKMQERAELAVRTLTWMAYHDAVHVGLVWLSAELAQGGVRARRMWVARFDKSTPPCSLCVRLHGTHVGMSESFPVLKEEPAPYGGVLSSPPRHSRCRCRIVPYLPDVAPAEQGPTPARLVAFAQRVLETNDPGCTISATIVRVKDYTRVVNGRTQHVDGYYYDIQTGRKVDPSQVRSQDVKEVSHNQVGKFKEKSGRRKRAATPTKDRKFSPGKYEIVMPDDSKTETVVHEDGSSTSTHGDQSEDSDPSQTTSFLSYWDAKGALKRTGKSDPESVSGKSAEDKKSTSSTRKKGEHSHKPTAKHITTLLQDAGLNEDQAKRLGEAVDRADAHHDSVSHVVRHMLEQSKIPKTESADTASAATVRLGDRDVAADQVRTALKALRTESSTSVVAPLRRIDSPLRTMPLRRWANEAEGRDIHYGQLKPAVIRLLENALGGRGPDRTPPPPPRPERRVRDVLLAPSRQESQFSEWGDRAAEIAASPGPSLGALRDLLRNSLGSREEGAIKQRAARAVERVYNGENGMGRSGATVHFHTINSYADMITFGGQIRDRDGNNIGDVRRSFHTDESGKFVELHNGFLALRESQQGQGIATDLYRRQENWAIAEGVEKITIDANIDVGGYAWARAGFDFANTRGAVQYMRRLQEKALERYGRDSESYQFILSRSERFHLNQAALPTPFEISRIGYTDGARTWQGKALMLGTDWSAVKKLVPPTPPPGPTPPPPEPVRPPTPPAPTGGRVRVGQVLVAREQVQEAIDLLVSERSTSVTGPLRRTNNPLARVNLRQLANERAGTTLHYGRLKPAVIELLRDILARDDRDRTPPAPTPPPERVTPPTPPPAPTPPAPTPPAPTPVTGGGLFVGGVHVTPTQIRDAIQILRTDPSTSIRGPLERAGSPLASANLRQLADQHRGERVHYGRLKAAVIEVLEAKLANPDVSPSRPPRVSRITSGTHDAIRAAVSALPQTDSAWSRIRSRGGQLNYPTDLNGRLLAPPEYEQHLNSVMDAGRSFSEDLTDVLLADQEYARLQRGINEATGRRARQLERQQLRRRLTVMYEMLAEARGFGSVRQERVSGSASMVADVSAMEKLFPDDWLRLINAQRAGLSLSRTQRGFFRSGGQIRPDTIAVSGSSSASNYYRAVGSHRREILLHELGHRMEMVVPGLRELQFTLLRQRATHDGRLESAVPIYSQDNREVALVNRWRNRYTARTYEGRSHLSTIDPASEHWEVFQTGLQYVIAGNTSFEDRDLEGLVFGALLTLGRRN